MAVEEQMEAPEGAVDEEMSADDIDEGFIPSPRPGVGGVEIDGEAVLLVEGTGEVHWLNQIGTVVFGEFDGVRTLDQLITELSRSFDADREAVRGDVLDMTRRLGRAGILEGVAAAAPEPIDDTPTGLDVGTKLPPFQLQDLNGRKLTQRSLRGRQTLLVNWSPSCGFCERIASDLSGLQADMKKNGVRLVFISFGPVEDHREQMKRHGLKPTVLLLDGMENVIFPGVGTPAAYLVDGKGRTASELTVGADKVPVLAKTAAGLEEETQEPRPEEGNGETHDHKH